MQPRCAFSIEIVHPLQDISALFSSAKIEAVNETLPGSCEATAGPSKMKQRFNASTKITKKIGREKKMGM